MYARPGLSNPNPFVFFPSFSPFRQPPLLPTHFIKFISFSIKRSLVKSRFLVDYVGFLFDEKVDEWV